MVEKNDNSRELDNVPLRDAAYWILIISPIFLLVLGSWNLYLASELGGHAGYDLWSLFQSWNSGIDITIRHSETYLRALKRLTTAIFQLSAGISTLIAAIAVVCAYRGEKK